MFESSRPAAGWSSGAIVGIRPVPIPFPGFAPFLPLYIYGRGNFVGFEGDTREPALALGGRAVSKPQAQV